MSTSLESNKILAGILAAGLLAMATGKIADTLRHPTELAENAYKIEVTEEAATAAAPTGPAPVEPILGLLAAADPAAGEKAAKKCVACHSFDEGGAKKVGPNLWDVVNAPKASKDGYAYSTALAGFTDPKDWTYSSLNKFLYKPKDYVSGTKMGFAGVKKASERAAIVAYLRTLAATPAPLPTVEEIQAVQEAYKQASGG
ncbi:MAG: cytochrome c family protein [Alphaproteobacteria bacterium]|nr:cytochrome c family protein [Alphaproteobacteria bacterium]